MLSTLMAGAQPLELEIRADRLEGALHSAGEVGSVVLTEIRTALDLIRAGQPCAAVSALLAARSGLVSASS